MWSVSRCVAARCSALQRVAARCSALQRVAPRYTALQCAAVLVPILLVDLECAVVDAADTLDVGTPLDPPVTTPEERFRRRPPSGEFSLEASGLRERVCVSLFV